MALLNAWNEKRPARSATRVYAPTSGRFCAVERDGVLAEVTPPQVRMDPEGVDRGVDRDEPRHGSTGERGDRRYKAGRIFCRLADYGGQLCVGEGGCAQRRGKIRHWSPPYQGVLVRPVREHRVGRLLRGPGGNPAPSRVLGITVLSESRRLDLPKE